MRIRLRPHPPQARDRGAFAAAVLLWTIALCTNLPASPLPALPREEDGYLRLGFDWLAAFRFEAPPLDGDGDPATVPERATSQIPPPVREWNGRKAIVTGFMMPTRLQDGLATEFLLVKDPSMCCYGVTPAMNEWILVKMTKGVRAMMDVPVSFCGTLTVGPVMENGYLTGIYELKADRMMARR